MDISAKCKLDLAGLGTLDLKVEATHPGTEIERQVNTCLDTLMCAVAAFRRRMNMQETGRAMSSVDSRRYQPFTYGCNVTTHDGVNYQLNVCGCLLTTLGPDALATLAEETLGRPFTTALTPREATPTPEHSAAALAAT